MDEPAAGLDPRARIELRELLKVLSTQGKAILISSHILTELAEICTGAVIIERGKILRAGSLSRILTVDVPQRTLLIRNVVGGEEACWELLAHLVRNGYRVVEFHQQQAGLEELFMNVTRGEVQ
jgi:ABC-2 type transport system ATP-binding protein